MLSSYYALGVSEGRRRWTGAREWRRRRRRRWVQAPKLVLALVLACFPPTSMPGACLYL
jgi:hypothetical protein